MARALDEVGPSESETDAKRKIVAAVKSVAEKLGNKPATCRSYYVHPCVIEKYTQGKLPAMKDLVEKAESDEELSAREQCVLKMITEAVS